MITKLKNLSVYLSVRLSFSLSFYLSDILLTFLLEDDILGPNQSGGDAAVRSVSGSGRALARDKDHATQLGNVILGMKELLAMNGVSKIKAAQLIGRMALDF